MTATLATIRLELRDRLGLGDNDPMVGEGDYDRAINSALQAVAAERDWPWLLASATFAVVPGVATITVTEAVSKVLVARLGTDDPLEFMSRGGLDLVFSPTDSGTPVAFTLAGNTITLRPVPTLAATLTLTYYTTEPTLLADSDTTLLPARFQPIVVERAASTLLRRVRNHDRAREADEAYNSWLVRMHDDQRRSAGSGQVKVRPGGWI